MKTRTHSISSPHWAAALGGLLGLGCFGGAVAVPAETAAVSASPPDAQAGPAFTDDQWVGMSATPGIRGKVTALAQASDGTLYVGGRFSAAGGIPVHNVAQWDGVQWSALGAGLAGEKNASVEALAVAPDGTLYAGGAFTTAGGAPVAYVAKWDGTAWSPLGTGMDAPVHALAVAPDGTLYAGGTFTTAGGVSASHIARWDGMAWSALGAGTDDVVDALAVAGDGTLYVGGEFTTADGISAAYVAKWNGVDWSPLGKGVNFPVYALAVAPEGILYVGGAFWHAGETSALRVAQWDGATWSALGTGMSGGFPGSQSYVQALAVADDGTLYAGGSFTKADGVSAPGVAKWNGQAWSSLGKGMNGPVWALVIGTNGQLHVGGWFSTAGNAVGVQGIARWDGRQWSAIGTGLAPLCGAEVAIYALASAGEGMLYAGGMFALAGDVATQHIALWSGGRWSALGRGLSGSMNSRAVIVYALAVADDGTLYAGGSFTKAGGVSAPGVAKWDGQAWSSLGKGMNGPVRALAVGPDGILYAGGEFTVAGEVSALHLARWDGTAWSPMGAGMDDTVFALAVADDGALYAGGAFQHAGGTLVNHVARWDGTQWTPLGAGTDHEVWALALAANDTVYAGGRFNTAGGVPAAHVAKWDGAAWSSLGKGMPRFVTTLTWTESDGLYAGGSFVSAGEVSARRVARWDGSAWSALGSGLDSPRYSAVEALAWDEPGVLYVGGFFDTAGGKKVGPLAKALLNGLEARHAGYVRAPGQALEIPVADVVTEVHGNPVSVVSAGPSEHGTPVTWDDTRLIYAPDHDQADSFSYTVSNGAHTSTGVITITVVPPEGVARKIAVGNGVAVMEFTGLPGQSYDVQRAERLSEPASWTTLNPQPMVANPGGAFSFTDTTPPVETAYYRCVPH